MAAETSIEWTDMTWNPVTGCTKVSQGCKHCYAEKLFPRPYPGRKFTDVRCHPERIAVPLHWRRGRRIFVNSMSDLFHEEVPFTFVDRVFATISVCPQHTFQILTKRAERMRAFMDRSRQVYWGFFAAALLHAEYGGSPGDAVHVAEVRGLRGFPPINTWLGVSAEDQHTADERIPHLRETSAHVRFVSCEPLLERIDLTAHLNGPGAIDWVIVGAESGPHARPFSLEWLEDLVDQCLRAQVPIFAKQVGARPSQAGRPFSTIQHRKGADMREWPEHLRIRQFPREGVPHASQ